MGKTYEDLSRRALIKLNKDFDQENDAKLLEYLTENGEKYESISDRMEIEIANYLTCVAEGRLSSEGKEEVQEIPIIQLHSFKDHPFQVVPDEKLLESVKEYGVLSPLLARKRTDGEYEMISGHRRKAASEQVGLEKLPVLVRELTDEEPHGH